MSKSQAKSSPEPLSGFWCAVCHRGIVVDKLVQGIPTTERGLCPFCHSPVMRAYQVLPDGSIERPFLTMRLRQAVEYGLARFRQKAAFEKLVIFDPSGESAEIDSEGVISAQGAT